MSVAAVGTRPAFSSQRMLDARSEAVLNHRRRSVGPRRRSDAEPQGLDYTRILAAPVVAPVACIV
jgi:hypothetical protein